MALNQKAIKPEQKEELLAELNKNFNREQGEIKLQGLGVLIEKLKVNYQDIVTQYNSSFNQDINDAIFEKLQKEIDPERWNDLWRSIGGVNLDDKARDGLEQMLSNLQPTKQDLEEVAQSYKDLGQVPPENITKGLLDVYRLEMMTGSTDHMFDIFAAQIATSPSAQKAVQEAVKAGGEIPQELAESLEDNYGLVYNAQTGMFDQIKKPVPTKIQEIQNIMRESGLNISDSLAESLTEKAPDVQEKAIDLLKQLQTAEASKRPDILKQLFDLGVAIDNSLGMGIVNNLEFVESQTAGMVDVIDTTTDTKITEVTPEFAERLRQMSETGFDAMNRQMLNENLTAPNVDYISQQYAYKWAQDAQTKFEDALSGLKLAANVGFNIGINAIGGHAEGGIFSTPHIAAFAEDGPEAVIPLSPKYRIQGYEIWQRAGEELGLAESARKSMLKLPPPSNGIDYDLLAKKIAAELRKAPLEVNSNVEVHNNNNLEIDLDGEIIGRKTAPTISRILSKK